MDDYYALVYRRGCGQLIVDECTVMRDADDPDKLIFVVVAFAEDAELCRRPSSS